MSALNGKSDNAASSCKKTKQGQGKHSKPKKGKKLLRGQGK